MRFSIATVLVLWASLAAAGAVRAQQAPAAHLAAPRPAATCPGNSNALGVSRTVEIDTTGGPAVGFQQFKAYDFLRDHEVRPERALS